MSDIKIHNGVTSVKATNGNTHLGGQDIDNTLTLHCMEELRKSQGIDISGDDLKISKQEQGSDSNAKRLWLTFPLRL